MATVFGGKHGDAPKYLKDAAAKAASKGFRVKTEGFETTTDHPVEITETIAAKSSKPAKIELSASQHKLMLLLRQIDSVVIERQELNRLTIAAALAGCNLFIGGSPGEAKTYGVETISRCFDLNYRYQLFAPDTMPDEFLGDREIAQFTDESGVTRTKAKRNLEGGLAKAHFFAADEIFKSSSPARNAQLGIMNERRFNDGEILVECPLKLYVGMSNELPQSSQDAAFWDRLGLRYWVKPTSWKGRKKLAMRAAGLEKNPEISITLSLLDLEAMIAESQNVVVTEAIVDKALKIAEQASAFNKEISTRKIVQMVGMLKAWAYVNGSMEVRRSHLAVLQHVFWGKLSHIEQLQQVCEAELGNQDAALKGIVEKIKGIDASILYGKSLASTTRNVREALVSLEANKEDFSEKAYKAAYEVISAKFEELQAKLEKEYTL